jgi:hypothetical protein
MRMMSSNSMLSGALILLLFIRFFTFVSLVVYFLVLTGVQVVADLRSRLVAHSLLFILVCV